MFLKSMIRKPYIWVASFLCLVIGSCKDFEDCRSIYTSQVMIQFLANDKDPLHRFSFTSIVPNNVLKGNDLSKPLPNPFPIFLNPAADSTTLYIHNSKPTPSVDTVTIYYQRYASLISPQCGAQQEYILDSLYTTFAGDSIINKALRRERDKQNTADVQIFY
jgi:hypothetical protein